MIQTSRILTIMSALVALYSSGINAGEKVLQSRISEVTVYADRAQIGRFAKVELPAGEHTLVFDALPEDIDQQSLMADGNGPALLREVKFRRIPFAGNDSLSIVLLHRKVIFEDSLKLLEDQVTYATGEKAFIASIAKRITESGEKEMAAPELDPAKWMKMVEFYRSRMDALGGEIRIKEKAKRAVSDSIKAISQRIANTGKGSTWSNQAEVLVRMKEQGTLSLNITYVVYGPSWIPAYEIRVGSGSKKIQLSYLGTVTQNTGEDWENVQIKLSTAKPQIGGELPVLTPWYVRIRPPQPRYSVGAARSSAKMQKRSLAMPEAEPAMESMEMFDAMAAPPSPMAVSVAQVETGASSVAFAVQGRSTLMSDNAPHKLTVMTSALDAKFSYSSVPKVSPFAYLRAEIKNNTEFPLLAGPASVFFDNNFVSTTMLKTISPGEEFSASLGIDEAVKVEHKLVNRVERKDGMISKKKKIDYEYRIDITNNRKTAEEISLLDQVPLSQSGDVSIELTDPNLKDDSDSNPSKNEEGFLEWNITLKPGEKKRFPLKFTVEYPADKDISGL